MYRLTQEILSVAANNPDLFQEGRKERQGYFERKRRESLEMRKTGLQYLIDTLEYRISNYHPRLRSIFMPLAAFREYRFGRVRVIIPPKRWEEPLVQYFLGEFSKLMSQSDRIRPNNESIESDNVYHGIMNPDITNAILERRMPKEEYEKLERILKGQGHKYPLQSGQTTTALQVRQSREIVPAEDLERRLDNLPPTVLAVEAGLHPQTVKKHKETGLSGQDIIDEGFMITKLGTHADLIHRLRRYNVPQHQWDDLIDTARQYHIPVATLVRTMQTLGASDIEEILDAVGEMDPEVSEFTTRHRMRREIAWYITLSIYSGDGRGDINKTLDILKERYWGRLDEELFSDALKIEER